MKKSLLFGLFLSILLTLSTTLAQEPTTVASDLNGPMGLAVDDEGNLWIVESGRVGMKLSRCAMRRAVRSPP